ncbi:hypothetical protein KCU95_g235, partial [Aureobasidium melanogenum]
MHDFSTPSSRWQALVTRNPAANNKFVYCVRTTRIYCRPICKARLARRANVEFFATPFEAENAGYRACKRLSKTAEPETRTTLAEAGRYGYARWADQVPFPSKFQAGDGAHAQSVPIDDYPKGQCIHRIAVHGDGSEYVGLVRAGHGCQPWRQFNELHNMEPI